MACQGNLKSWLDTRYARGALACLPLAVQGKGVLKSKKFYSALATKKDVFFSTKDRFKTHLQLENLKFTSNQVFYSAFIYPKHVKTFSSTSGYKFLKNDDLTRSELDQSSKSRRNSTKPKWNKTQALILSVAVTIITYKILFEYVPPFRFVMLAVVRSTRVVIAVIGAMSDYKTLFAKSWPDDSAGRAQRHLDYQTTHLSAARRILNVLKQNGGIFVKLGQHLSSVQLIPIAWSSTMRPLQDQCLATPYELIDQLFFNDVGVGIEQLFDRFDPQPIGVASLAQVHRARDRETGREVAVKVMHPSLEEYLEIDTQTVIVMLKLVKWVFPEFEFSWLGEEMKENLPKEMDFRLEAANAVKCSNQFSNLEKSALKIPDVLWAKKRVLVMEYITGGRFDDLEYLAEHKIDRNRASQELARIFSQMIYLNGYFHADPHAGNLLIRPAPTSSKSPHNFEIVLLDHGLYFDLSDQLRVNYAKFWLSLLTSSPTAERRKLAKLVGNISDENYDIFESAITGRVGMKGSGSLMSMYSQTKEEQQLIRSAIIEREGIVPEILRILRNMPRRLLMILKVNDLTRALDLSLKTTHSAFRIWLIFARYCRTAIWRDELNSIKNRYFSDGFSLSLFFWWSRVFWEHQKWHYVLGVAEFGMDLYASLSKTYLWIKGLTSGGFRRARREAAGLAF
ncbi:atypical/ABC1/ABC1-B protein kinase [Phakopsora pachyrhizi]|uniref:Atypical/ABC1/ABC1-B protein kinase n=1 Tax=Phakopsora pachyrhizi TaxID=170000 RepID=A0AAV0BH58_PHAPC|nr:atypical/ABC1/ABC1-B protein kinase [Phakopsora pachyrhizi]